MGRMTISNTASLWSPADYSGTLYKRAGGCRPGWKKYFFALKDFSPRGVIPLEQAEIAEGKRTQGIIDRRDKYIISVTVDPSFQCKKPVYLLSARSSSGQTEWLQVLQAHTIPHADLAARVSKLSMAEVAEATGEEVYDQNEVSNEVDSEFAADADQDEDEESDDDIETEMAPDPSGNGALEDLLDPSVKAAKVPGKKAFRFASPSTLEQHAEVLIEGGDAKKKFKKPKGSVYISNVQAFDFHGDELTEDDAAVLADLDGAEGASPAPQQQIISTDMNNPHQPFRPEAATYATPSTGSASHANDVQAYMRQAQSMAPVPPVTPYLHSSPGPSQPQTPSPRGVRVMSQAGPHQSPEPPGMVPDTDDSQYQYRDLAESMAPFDWGSSGAPRFTAYMTPQQATLQSPQGHHEQQRSHSDLLPMPPQSSSTNQAPTTTVARKQTARSMHAGSAPAPNTTLTPPPGSSTRAAVRSVAPADWGSDGLPRASQFVRSLGPSDEPVSPVTPHSSWANDGNGHEYPAVSGPPSPGGPSQGPHRPPSASAAGPGYAAGGPDSSSPAMRAAAAKSLAPMDWSSAGLPESRSSAALSAASPSMHFHPNAPVDTRSFPSPSEALTQASDPYNSDQRASQMQLEQPQAQYEAFEHMSQQPPSAGAMYMSDAQHSQSQHMMQQAQQQFQLQPSRMEAPVQHASYGDPHNAAPRSSEAPHQSHAQSMAQNTAASQDMYNAPAPVSPPEVGQRASGHEPASIPAPQHLEPTAQNAQIPAQQAEQLAGPAASGGTMQEFTKTLEDLKGTVANMRDSLQRNPGDGTRSVSPSHERAAEALARARATLRTVAAFRNPGGHSKSTHARTATFDVADFSRANTPVDTAISPRLQRHASMSTAPNGLVSPLTNFGDFSMNPTQAHPQNLQQQHSAFFQSQAVVPSAIPEHVTPGNYMNRSSMGGPGHNTPQQAPVDLFQPRPGSLTAPSAAAVGLDPRQQHPQHSQYQRNQQNLHMEGTLDLKPHSSQYQQQEQGFETIRAHPLAARPSINTP